MKKIPIINEKDLDALIKEAIKNEGVLTAPTGYCQMLINIKGVSINAKPRKDGRFQGYIKENGQKYYFYGKSKDEVAFKIKFCLQNGMPKKKKADTHNGVPTTFNSFAMYYFENFRKKKVAELTYKIDLRRYKKHILPIFNETPLKRITPIQCQKLIENLKSQDKGKTADEVYSLLSVIFKTAIKHSVLTKNPLDVIYHEKHERKNGVALTKAEELSLKKGLQGTNYLPFCMLSLYTGLRPNELKTAYIDGDFIVAVNSKRKNHKLEYKKIPIIKALKPYIKNGLPKIPRQEPYRLAYKSILPNHILYDLRTTFYSRCKEYGVSEYALSAYMGHSLGAIGNAYTDLSDEYLLEESKKLDAWE